MFGRKERKEDKENSALLKKLHGKHIRYATKRHKENNTEEVIGKDGYINITDEELIICCGDDVFRAPLCELKAWELLSLDGVALELENSEFSIVAYYKYHR